MSMPAARVGDTMAHGGAIIPPGAAPQKVLIKNQPAARVGDFQTCPLVTPIPPPPAVVPHVGGPIVVGVPTVLLGGLPAARVTSAALCTLPIGPMPINTIIPPGGGTPPPVLIGLGSATAPVTYQIVGDPAAMFAVFPGKQKGNTCVLQSSKQLVQKGTGTTVSDADMKTIGAKHGYKEPGGTPPSKIPDIVDEASGGKLQAQATGPVTSDNAAGLLEQGKGVTAGTDAGKLWNNPKFDGGGHRIVVTGAVKDPAGNVVGVIINDTGTGMAGQAMSATQFNAAGAGKTMFSTVQSIL